MPASSARSARVPEQSRLSVLATACGGRVRSCLSDLKATLQVKTKDLAKTVVVSAACSLSTCPLPHRGEL